MKPTTILFIVMLTLLSASAVMAEKLTDAEVIPGCTAKPLSAVKNKNMAKGPGSGNVNMVYSRSVAKNLQTAFGSVSVIQSSLAVTMTPSWDQIYYIWEYEVRPSLTSEDRDVLTYVLTAEHRSKDGFAQMSIFLYARQKVMVLEKIGEMIHGYKIPLQSGFAVSPAFNAFFSAFFSGDAAGMRAVIDSNKARWKASQAHAEAVQYCSENGKRFIEE